MILLPSFKNGAEATLSRSDRPHRAEPCSAGFIKYLIECGRLDAMAGERAAAVQRQTGQRIDIVLSQLGLISDQSLLDGIAHYFNLTTASLATMTAQPPATAGLTMEFMKRHRVIPLILSDSKLVLATANPFDVDLISAISFLVECPVEMVLASQKDMDRAIAQITKLAEEPSADEIDEDLQAGLAFEDDVQRLRDIASEAPIIRMVHRLIAAAAGLGVSDIHVEPMTDCVRVRHRVDGLLREVERLPRETQEGIVTRIKILAKLNIAERRLPQDGRTKFVVGGREIDLRVSTTPVLHGENVVLRILDTEHVDLSLEALGFDGATCVALTTILTRPNGMVLVTGPTGSGKTTTLYAALRSLNTIERKVFTVEDPIEYQLAGVSQIQIKPDIGLGFVECLRSILRQDPDVIMIGEMRDKETASTTIRAALTGHLVLSTLHTNSAAASITRLLDMEVEDYLLASSLLCVLAQRLVRRLCPSCAAAVPEGAQQFHQLLQHLPATKLAAAAVRQPVGCSHCNYSGFRGRTTIGELLVVDDNVRSRIRRGTTDREIEQVGLGNGMRTLYHSGVEKVLAGETTIEEVLRVAHV